MRTPPINDLSFCCLRGIVTGEPRRLLRNQGWFRLSSLKDVRFLTLPILLWQARVPAGQFVQFCASPNVQDLVAMTVLLEMRQETYLVSKL